MFICPISGFKMRQARARGGSLWYCPHSRGRAVTLEMAKKYLGDDATREIWVRSEYKFQQSSVSCPSCRRQMRKVSEPGWAGGGEIDVCRSCHLIWVNPGEHPQVPVPEDLITPRGDSTLVKDAAEGAKDLLLLQEAEAERKNTLVGEGPEGLFKQLPAFLGLPVEISDRAKPSGVLVTYGSIGLLVAIHWIWTSRNSELIRTWGFYPADPWKNGGLNALISPFLHGGWFHLLFNLYFFSIFSDDVEEELGFSKYLLFFVFTAVSGGVVLSLISASPWAPHIGLSGFVMALMAYYALQFPNSRMAYILPVVHSLPLGGGSVWLRTWKWFRLPVWGVFLIYLTKDIIQYFLFEKSHLSSVAHSAHVAGVGAGVVFWFLFSKAKMREGQARTATVVRGLESNRIPDRKMLLR